jgi:hypothetical protein
MKLAYKTTSVPVERSKQAIRDLLIKSGVRGVQFTEEFNSGAVNLRFAKEINGNLRTVNVTMKIPEPPVSKRGGPRRRWTGGGYVTTTTEDRRRQLERATYRALHWWLKSQFEAVEFGLLSFEDVFLSHFEWVIDGKQTTVGRFILPRISNGNNLLPAEGGTAVEGKVRVIRP